MWDLTKDLYAVNTLRENPATALLQFSFLASNLPYSIYIYYYLLNTLLCEIPIKFLSLWVCVLLDAVMHKWPGLLRSRPYILGPNIGSYPASAQGPEIFAFFLQLN